MKRPYAKHDNGRTFWEIALLLTVAWAGLAQAAEIIDAILATVDTEVILHSDVMQEIAPFVADLRLSAATPEEFQRKLDERLSQALDQAIENKILLRQALLAGIDVEDATVEERIETIRRRYPSNEAFLAELEKAGETMSDFRERMRKQMLAISMGMRKRREFERGVVVSEVDVTRYYDEHQDEFARPERVRLRRIFLAVSDEAQRIEVRARLEELVDQLASGSDFAELARAHSEGPEAENGGMVGWVGRGDLVEDLEKAAFGLSEGGVSDVVETTYGFHLLKVEERRAAGTPSLDEVRTETEPKLRAAQADERYRKWIAELRKRSQVRLFL
ncbi:MAG TPA: hypothetical protein ENN80_11985 [Candidatus Hydrogenedentes bacterium]|nr:hypothetical protein [Candidatus Hydrogenedentota bacterium]